MHGRALMGPRHKSIPDGTGAQATGHVDHLGVVIVANPDSGGDIGRVPHRPGVTEIVGRARLRCRRSIGQLQGVAGTGEDQTARLAVRENVCQQIRITGVRHLTARTPPVIDQHLARVVLDPEKRRYRHLQPAVGKGRVGRRQLQRLHLAAAQRQRQPVERTMLAGIIGTLRLRRHN